MKMTITIIIILFGAFLTAYAGDHYGDYLNDQVPIDYEDPLWLKTSAWNLFRIVIGGTIFFSVSGYPDNKLLSFRSVILKNDTLKRFFVINLLLI